MVERFVLLDTIMKICIYICIGYWLPCMFLRLCVHRSVCVYVYGWVGERPIKHPKEGKKTTTAYRECAGQETEPEWVVIFAGVLCE